MAKEAFNRKRGIFCGSLEKELLKRLVKFFVWSVALYSAETWTLRRNEQKRLKAFGMWICRRMERVKQTDKIKNAIVLESVGEGRIMLEVIKKNKRNWLGHQLRRNYLLKDTLKGMVKGRKFAAEESGIQWKIVEYGEYCKSEETSVTYRVSWKSVGPFSSDASPNTQTEKKNSKM